MRIFICYSSRQLTQAEAVRLRLVSGGHQVFLDRCSLPAGTEFDSRIREAILNCHLFIFLVSPDSLTPGSYCLTELKIAADRWRHPAAHVLPVMLVKVPLESVPEYLKAVTLLEPRGNAAAEISQAVAQLSRDSRIRAVKSAAWVAGPLSITMAAWLFFPRAQSLISTIFRIPVVVAAANSRPLPGDLFTRVRTVVAAPQGYLLGLADPNEVIFFQPNGHSPRKGATLPGEPVSMTTNGGIVYVATAYSNTVVRLALDSLQVEETLAIPELAVTNGDSRTLFSSLPVSLIVSSNDIWLITSQYNGDAGLIYKPPQGDWMAPMWVTNFDFAADISGSQLYQYHGRALMLTSSSPHYIYELTRNQFTSYSGHDYSDSIGCFDAIDFATNGNLCGLGSDFQYLEIGLEDGKVRLLGRGSSLPDSYGPGSWDYEKLIHYPAGLLIGLTQVQRGNDYRLLQAAVVKMTWAGKIDELLTRPDATVAGLAAQGDTAVAVLRGSNHVYEGYLVDLK